MARYGRGRCAVCKRPGIALTSRGNIVHHTTAIDDPGCAGTGKPPQPDADKPGAI